MKSVGHRGKLEMESARGLLLQPLLNSSMQATGALQEHKWNIPWVLCRSYESAWAILNNFDAVVDAGRCMSYDLEMFVLADWILCNNPESNIFGHDETFCHFREWMKTCET